MSDGTPIDPSFKVDYQKMAQLRTKATLTEVPQNINIRLLDADVTKLDPKKKYIIRLESDKLNAEGMNQLANILKNDMGIKNVVIIAVNKEDINIYETE